MAKKYNGMHEYDWITSRVFRLRVSLSVLEFE